MSFKYRTALTLLALQALLLAGVLGRALTLTGERQRIESAASEQILLRLLGELGRAAAASGDLSNLQSLLERLETETPAEHIFLTNRENRIVASSRPGEVGQGLPAEPSFGIRLGKAGRGLAGGESKARDGVEQGSLENPGGVGDGIGATEGSDNLAWHAQDSEHWRALELRDASGPLGLLAIRFSDARSLAIEDRIGGSLIGIAILGGLGIAALGLLFGAVLTRRLEGLNAVVEELEASITTGTLSPSSKARPPNAEAGVGVGVGVSKLRRRGDMALLGRQADDLAARLKLGVAQLRRREQQLELITDSLPVGITYLDRSYRFLFANREVARWLGHRVEVITGSSISEIMSLEDSEETKRGLAPAMKGTFHQRERTYVIGDREHIVEATNVPDFDEEGRVRGAVSLLRNVTFRRQRQRERERLVQELEEKNSDLERFAHAVSHDLKSPLVTILGRADLLAEDLVELAAILGISAQPPSPLPLSSTSSLPSSPDPGQGSSETMTMTTPEGLLLFLQEHLAEIQHAAESMERMLEEVLDLARAGHATESFEEIDLHEITEHVLRLLGGRLDSTGLRVVVEGRLPKVRGERASLERILLNLLDNAIKFGQDSARPRVEVGYRRLEGKIRLHVCDHGAGLAAGDLERIFEPFEQVDPDSGGTGLGLAICRRIAEAHGGRVWATSAGVGQGTCLYLSLPDSAPEP